MSYDEAKEVGYGKVKRPDSDNPNGPRLKGWVKINNEMCNITIWTSKKEPGEFNVKIEESLKKGPPKPKYDRAGDRLDEDF